MRIMRTTMRRKGGDVNNYISLGYRTQPFHDSRIIQCFKDLSANVVFLFSACQIRYDESIDVFADGFVFGIFSFYQLHHGIVGFLGNPAGNSVFVRCHVIPFKN